MSVTNSGSDKAGCSFSGQNYIVSAGAGYDAPSGGLTGYVQADAGADLQYDGIGQFAGSVSTETSFEAHFTSAGPVRLGKIYIRSLSTPGVTGSYNGFYNFSSAFAGFTLTQGNFSYQDVCTISDSTICNGEILPLYLGVPFTISVQTGVGFSFINRDFDYYDEYNYENIDYPDEATFQLYESNGLTLVNSIVLPDQSTSAPEPSTQAGTLALLLILVLLNRPKKSSPAQEPNAATPRW